MLVRCGDVEDTASVERVNRICVVGNARAHHTLIEQNDFLICTKRPSERKQNPSIGPSELKKDRMKEVRWVKSTSSGCLAVRQLWQSIPTVMHMRWHTYWLDLWRFSTARSTNCIRLHFRYISYASFLWISNTRRKGAAHVAGDGKRKLWMLSVIVCLEWQVPLESNKIANGPMTRDHFHDMEPRREP